MRAIAISEVGGPERLELMEIPVPVPGSDEVLVRVEAAGVNEVDTLLREGFADSGARPLVMGSDFSGVIELVGDDVHDLAVGDAVYEATAAGNGTYAEFVAMPAAWVARKPTTISFEEAASLPCVGLTAYQSLVETLDPGPGVRRDRRRRRRGWIGRAAAGSRARACASSPRRVHATTSTCWAWGPRRSWTTRPATGSRACARSSLGVSTRRRAAAAARRSVALRRSCVTGDVSSGSREPIRVGHRWSAASPAATSAGRPRGRRSRPLPTRSTRAGCGRRCNTSTGWTRPRKPRYASRKATCGASS